jgi:hypothetical protein
LHENGARTDLDQVMWSDYVKLGTHAKVAEVHGVGQSTVSRAVARYTATIPEPERREHREKMMARYEELYQAHRSTALERPRVAAIVRGILDSQVRLLGLEPKELHVEGTIEHGHYQAGPTLTELLDQWREQGIIQPASSTTVERVP